ncbi:MAG: phosphohistidine phosphatase SixA [Cyanobacteria bacterium]|nr:phosphohistidine phosphatase SixA [Cyanobacteriota bacterium]
MAIVQTELYLIRHGIAAERGTYANDGDRPLTAKGIQRTETMVKRLGALGCRFDAVLTSPLVRAQQTADILVRLGLASTLETFGALAPGGQLHDWLSWLEWWQGHSAQGRVALVGHEPDLSDWGQRLVTGQGGDRWVLKKAGVIGLMVPAAEVALGQSELFWLSSPRLLLGQGLTFG